MISRTRSLLVCSFLTLTLAVPGLGAVLVYDNLSTAATAGYSEPAANTPVFGDSLTLAQGGLLESFGLTLFNSTSGGNTGTIMAGTMEVKFYDNTVAYDGGALDLPLLGAANLGLDFTLDGGLPPGYFVSGVFDLSALGLNLPTDILVTQQFTQMAGNSTRIGFVLFGDPVVGSSPNTVYLKSTDTPEDLYTFTNNPGQVGYAVTVVPEPATLVLAGLGIAAVSRLRRRR